MLSLNVKMWFGRCLQRTQEEGASLPAPAPAPPYPRNPITGPAGRSTITHAHLDSEVSVLLK